MTTKNALVVVNMAKSNPSQWQGDKIHEDEVVFSNSVYTVGSNGDVEDFHTAGEAAKALRWCWDQEDKRV